MLPLLELDVEECRVVDDDTAEQPVELLVVDAVRPLDLAVEARSGWLDVDMPNAAIEYMPMEGGLELCAVVGLNELYAKGQPLQDVIDELNGGLLVEPVVDLEDPEPSAVVDCRVLVVPLAGAGERGYELDVDLDTVARLRFLIALPAILVPLVSLRAGQAIEAEAPEDSPDPTGADGDVVVALQIHRDPLRPEMVVLPKIGDLADHLLPGGVWAGVRALGTVPQTIVAELSIALEPDVKQALLIP
jgi:hypothetical protein